MRGNFLLFCSFFLCCISLTAISQTETIKLDAGKIEMFTPYVEARHGLTHEAFEEWKSVNKLQYTKEIWYFSESFYIKKNHLKSGVELTPSNIDISRFESHRQTDKEHTLVLPGFKDAIVLLPANKLIYKP